MIEIGKNIGYYKAKEYREDRKSLPVNIRGNWEEANLLRIDALPGIDFAIRIIKISYNTLQVRIDEISTGTNVEKVLVSFSSESEKYEKIRLHLERFEKTIMRKEKGSLLVAIQKAGVLNPGKIGKLIPLVDRSRL